MTRPTLRAVLVLVCCALGAGLLASCGDADAADDAASSAIAQTFRATSKLDSAKLTASVQLDPEGLLALGGPLAFRASGPFASGAKGELPRLDLQLAGTVARKALSARAISTGKRGFLRIDGRDYEIDREFIAELLSGDHDSAKKGGWLASLGLNPAEWIDDPSGRGEETIGGVATTRIAGDIDVENLLGDVAKLLGGGRDGKGGLLTPKLLEQIEDAVTSAKVDLWTGTQDKILRQLVAVVDFAFKTGTSPITGLDGGKITLRVRLDGVNATTVAPATPKHPRPLSDLTGDGGLGALIAGLGEGIVSGTGDGGDAFLKCLNSASGKTADIVECTSKLAP